MPLSLVSAWTLATLLLGPPARTHVTVGLAALHAAALTTSRGAADSADAPFLLVSAVRARTGESTHLPTSGHWRVAQDGVAPTTQVSTLELAPGDSVRLVISVLESDPGEPQIELGGAAATTEALGRLGHPLLDPADPLLGPALEALRKAGAHWMGSVSILVTNEGGAAYWRRMECAHECAVVKGLPAAGAPLREATSGVFELRGDGGTFHLQLSLQQTD